MYRIVKWCHQNFNLLCITILIMHHTSICTFDCEFFTLKLTYYPNMTYLNWLWGKSTLHPPNVVVTNIAFLQLVFLCKYKHHILDYFRLFEAYWIRFRIKTIILKENSNKHWWTLTYEVYFWQNNTHHEVWKIAYILQN
jgi:hypothetical protein